MLGEKVLRMVETATLMVILDMSALYLTDASANVTITTMTDTSVCLIPTQLNRSMPHPHSVKLQYASSPLS